MLFQFRYNRCRKCTRSCKSWHRWPWAVDPCCNIRGADDLAVMRRIDELHLELPFYGSRRMTFELNREGREVNRKRVRRLMRVMGIEALVPRPGTSKAAPGTRYTPTCCAA